VAVPSANEVRQYTLSGRYLKSLDSPFISPVDVACDATGNVFVIDRSPRKVLKFDSGGQVVADWAVGDSLFHSPAGIKIDRTNGEILIADIGHRRVVRLDRKGKHLASLELPGISEAQGQLYFDLDRVGNLFIPDLSNSRILVLNRDGIPFMVIGQESRGYGGVLGPLSVALRQGKVHVYSRYLERITVFRLDGLPMNSKRHETRDNPSYLAR
jgi:DNA-binding beta-propeller fold protein YncE